MRTVLTQGEFLLLASLGKVEREITSTDCDALANEVPKVEVSFEGLEAGTASKISGKTTEQPIREGSAKRIKIAL